MERTIACALRYYDLPYQEARRLLSLASGHSIIYLVAYSDNHLSDAVFSQYQALCERRLSGEPMAYIIQEQAFYGRDFWVNESVLIPRPETELLVDLALSDARASAALRVLDMGCGSGAIACTLALERPSWSVAALDISQAALRVAKHNAEILGVAIDFYQGDWFAPVCGQRFDMIISNPPYIERDDMHLMQGDLRFEPQLALTDQADGLRCLAHIIEHAPAFLTEGGRLMLEHGYNQGGDCRALMLAAGYRSIKTYDDLAGIERVTEGFC